MVSPPTEAKAASARLQICLRLYCDIVVTVCLRLRLHDQPAEGLLGQFSIVADEPVFEFEMLGCYDYWQACLNHSYELRLAIIIIIINLKLHLLGLFEVEVNLDGLGEHWIGSVLELFRFTKEHPAMLLAVTGKHFARWIRSHGQLVHVNELLAGNVKDHNIRRAQRAVLAMPASSLLLIAIITPK